MTSNDLPDPARPSGSLPAWVMPGLRIVATAALMWYALSDIDWLDTEVDGTLRPGMASVLRGARWSWWALGLVTSLLVQFVAGIRWAALARPLGFDFPRRLFVWRFFEGMFFSLCLPSSIGGDVVKAYRVGDTTQRRLLAGCSVLADRLTGLAALAVLGATAFAVRKYELGLPATLAVAGLLLAAVLLGFLVGLAILDRVIAVIPEGGPVRSFLVQLLPYQRRPSVIAKAIAWSFVVQMGGALAVACAGRAVGVVQPLAVWFSVVPLVALWMVLPISIGGFGVREASMAYLLAEQGVPHAQGVAVALLWGLTTILTGLLGGILFLCDRRPRQPGE